MECDIFMSLLMLIKLDGVELRDGENVCFATISEGKEQIEGKDYLCAIQDLGRVEERYCFIRLKIPCQSSGRDLQACPLPFPSRNSRN